MAGNLNTTKYIVSIEGQGAEQFIRKMKDAAKSQEDLQASFRKTSTASGGLVDCFTKLTYRAAITIPVWLALRSAFMGTLRIFNDAADSIVKLDIALVDAKNELTGTSNLSSVMDNVKESAIALAKETGVAADVIVKSFRMFVTAGLDAQTSLAGMNTAVRGSVATMGDSVETARILADIYNVMGSRITEVSCAQEKMNFIMNTMATLMPTNVFTIQEMSESLKNFASVASSANLTLDQMMTLLAVSSTGMQRGGLGGTRLAQTFNLMLENIKEVQRLIGDTSEMSQFDIIFKIIEKANEMMKSSPQGEAPSILLKIFGARGTVEVKSLISMFEHFVSELARLKDLSPDARQAQFLERYGTAMEKIAKQADRFGQIRNDLMRSFFEGLSGGMDYASVLKNINDQLEKMETRLKNIAELIRLAFEVPITAGKEITDWAFPQSFRNQVNKVNPIRALGLGFDYNEALDNQMSAEAELAEARNKFAVARARQTRIAAGLEVNLPKIVVSSEDHKKSTETPELDMKIDDRLALMQRMETFGYNQLEIDIARLNYVMKNYDASRDQELLDKSRLQIARDINEEIIKY